MAVLVGVVTKPHTALTSVRPEFAAIVDRCLEKRAAARFDTARELGEALLKLRVGAGSQPAQGRLRADPYTPTVALEKGVTASRSADT